MKKVDWLAGSLSSLILAQALPARTTEAQVEPKVNPDISTVASRQNESFVKKAATKQIAPPETLPIARFEGWQDADAVQQSEDPMAQLTSVSQLADVRPGDWAFQAVQTLVERYGVIGGYPDGTFRGNRPLSRSEFSAALDAVLSKIEEQLLTGNLDETAQQDILTVQRLLTAYGSALNDLRQRLDTITSRNRDLEAQQFSTTTKLNGQTVFAVTNGTNDRLDLISRTRLTLTSSFNGRDRLVSQLQFGNNGRDAIATAHSRQQNLLGTVGVLADGGGLDYVDVDSQVRLRKLYYVFQPAANVEVAVGSRLPPSDFIDRNSFANQSAENFASSFFANNPLIVQNEVDRFGGAGAAVSWNIRDNLTLRALYAAADAANSAETVNGGGLFGDRYQGSLEVEYALPRQPITLRLQYTHAEINGTAVDAAGVNAEWAITPQFGVFGRLGFGSYQGFNSVLERDLDLNPKTWAVGVTVRNFLIPGSKAGIALGQPFIESDLGNATQTNLEAYFGLLLNDNINFSPSLIVVSDPNNRESPTIFEWAVRFVIEY